MRKKPFAFVSSRLSPSYGRRIPFSKPQTVETHGEGKERRRKNNPGDFSSLSTSPFLVEQRNESNYSSRVKREGSWIRINWKQGCRCSVNTLLDGVRYDSTPLSFIDELAKGIHAIQKRVQSFLPLRKEGVERLKHRLMALYNYNYNYNATR